MTIVDYDATVKLNTTIDVVPTLKEALADAYAATETIEFEGKYMRHDIGQRALAAMAGL